MATFKEITSQDIKTSRSFLTQLVDIVQEDVSGSATRRTYDVFITGSSGSPGVTSSLFHTVYDQSFALNTSNAIFDMTVGLYVSGNTVQDAKTGDDTSGKILFPSQSLMMREKVDIYRQYSQALLGDADLPLYTPFGSTSDTDRIDEGLFLSFRRLFARDQIKRETFAFRFYQSASYGEGSIERDANLDITSISGSTIYTDAGSSLAQNVAFGGDVGNIVNSANTAEKVGLIFYEQGTAVLDLSKITSASQHMSGVIDAISTNAHGEIPAGQTALGDAFGNPAAKFIPDFLVSGSINNIVDHIAGTRFQSGSLSAITFQNVTKINSTLVFCRASADEFNYSSNPTYVDGDNRLVVIDTGEEDIQQSFSFVTTVGLYDANDNLLAVAKLSRPVEKTPEKDITLRIRMDF